jgi:hypothetical protein
MTTQETITTTAKTKPAKKKSQATTKNKAAETAKATKSTAKAAKTPKAAKPKGMGIVWLQIIDDNTNRKCKVSADGINFSEVHSVGMRSALPFSKCASARNPSSFNSKIQSGSSNGRGRRTSRMGSSFRSTL